EQKLCTVFMVDVSDSVTDESLKAAHATVDAALAKVSADDEVRLITFAERPRLETLTPSEGDARFVLPPLEQLRHAPPPTSAPTPGTPDLGNPDLGNPDPGNPTSNDAAPSAGTDIQAALELAYGVFPPGYLKRALLFSDGVETSGDVLAEANRAQRFGVRLHVEPYSAPP